MKMFASTRHSVFVMDISNKSPGITVWKVLSEFSLIGVGTFDGLLSCRFFKKTDQIKPDKSELCLCSYFFMALLRGEVLVSKHSIQADHFGMGCTFEVPFEDFFFLIRTVNFHLWFKKELYVINNSSQFQIFSSSKPSFGSNSHLET